MGKLSPASRPRLRKDVALKEIAMPSGEFVFTPRNFILISCIRFFLIAILSTVAIGMQNYAFSSAAAMLTSRLRMLSFRAILRQDSEFRF